MAAPIACTSRPIPSPESLAPSVLLPMNQGGIRDGRARFREIFRSVLAAHGSTRPSGALCDDTATLWKLTGEPPLSGKPVPSGPSSGGFRVVIVPGLLAECLEEYSRVFSDSRCALERLGYKTDYIRTGGRRGSAHNAAIIHEAAMKFPAEDRLVFVTHSKGAPDTLEALAEYPELARKTAAVVAVSGAVAGSPLATAFPEFLLRFAHSMPLPACEPGEGTEAVESLQRRVRLAWLSTHPLPPGVRYYSLPAFTRRENLSRILRPHNGRLSAIDPMNDGLVLCSDAVIPGSILLGFPNADHFAVAMPFDRERNPVLSRFIDKNDYPRPALLEAVARYVEEDLEGAQTSENES